MIGSVCNVGCNLKMGMEELGHSVTLVADESPFEDCLPDFPMQWGMGTQKFYGEGLDIVHIHSPNFKKYLLAFPYLNDCKLVCHWHGSDLRKFAKAFPMKTFFFRRGDMHLYSTEDLAAYIRSKRKHHLWCPIDTDVFKPDGDKGNGEITFNGGGKSYDDHKIEHCDMPDFLNEFETASIHNAYGLPDDLMSVIALECLSCGLHVNQFPKLDRKWVVDNASIPVVCKKLEGFYEEL